MMQVQELIEILSLFPKEAYLFFSYQEFMSIYGEGADNRLGDIFESGTFSDYRDGANDS